MSKENSRKSTEYYIVNGTYVGEVTEIGGQKFVITYLYGTNGIAGIDVNGSAYYFVKNLQGDVTGILDSNGNTVGTYEYEAYGVITAIKNAQGYNIMYSSGYDTSVLQLNPFRYRGYMFDPESEFYYLNSRYYDPWTSRFLNADAMVSTGQGFDGNNMFAYCLNNPVVYVDYTGCYCVSLLGDAIWVKGEKTPASSTTKPIFNSNNKSDDLQTGLEPDLYFAYGGEKVELKNGWTARIDKQSGITQKHIHIEKHGLKYAQNLDGSPHDGSTGSPPNSIKKDVLKKLGWDWDKKEKSYNNHKQSYIYDPNCDWENGNCEGHGIMPFGGLYYMPFPNGSMPMPAFSPFGVPAFG